MKNEMQIKQNYPQFISVGDRNYVCNQGIKLNCDDLRKEGIILDDIEQELSIITLSFRVSVGLYEDYLEMFEGANIKIYDKNQNIKKSIHHEILITMQNNAEDRLIKIGFPKESIKFYSVDQNSFEHLIYVDIECFIHNKNLSNGELNLDIPFEFMEEDNLLSIKIDDLIKNKMFAEGNLIEEINLENNKFLIYDLIEQLLPLPSKAIYTINSHYVENDCVNFYLEDSLIISQLSREDFLGIYDFYPIYPN